MSGVVPPPPRLQLLLTPGSPLRWGYPRPSTPTVELNQLFAGMQIEVGAGTATVLPDMDFETYSEAGYLWDPEEGKWVPPKGATKGGLPAVGAAVYAQHPTTEVLSFCYDLKDRQGPRHWRPGLPPPVELFDHIARGGLIEAHYSNFEHWIWNHVCVPNYGWPPLPLEQLRDSMAKARAHALPGALDNLGEVLDLSIKKDKEGKRLLDKFSRPRKPTKSNPKARVLPVDDPKDFENLCNYNCTDILTEAEASARIPDLPPDELQFWLATQRMNYRGVGIDVDAVRACANILEQALDKYNSELRQLTGGYVESASEVSKLREFLAGWGVHLDSLDEDAVDGALAHDIPKPARRALEIRQLVGSASVKKVYAMLRQATASGRVHDLFNYHGARTGRDTASDLQPQNLAKAGPKLKWCEDSRCGKPYGQHHRACPHCGTSDAFSKSTSWGWEAVPHALEAMKSGVLELVEYLFGDALLTISGCIRGLLAAARGHELIASDYSSIEAVVTAVLAGEQWRIDAFRRRECIYLVSASRITGIPLEDYVRHKKETGEHHPHRQKIGKPAELGLGFGGWLTAWRQFDSTDNFSDEEVKRNIVAWRNASPAIVELWGGQCRGKPWAPDYYELYGLEGAAIAAVQNPGQCYGYRGITYGVKDDVLYCRLLSGRLLSYHRPRLSPSTKWEGQVELSYEGWNSNPKMGPLGWIRIKTYGGRLTENVVQATARDIMRDGALRLEAAGYPMVLRVHDELVAEVPEGWGIVEEFERLMGHCEKWYAGWPIRASGGWRGKRYRKD